MRRVPTRRACLLAAALGGLAACAAIPEYDIRPPPPGAVPSARLIGARGPLTPARSHALLDRVVGGGGMLQRHLATEEAVADTPLAAGNRVRILRDGPEAFRAIFAAIDAAHDHVNLEFFVLDDVESDGRRLGDLLVAKQRAGVQVNVIYDSIGTVFTPDAFFTQLAGAGIRLLDFNPINPLAARAGYAPNDRDHRKILVVDGTTAIIGGINLSTDYQSHPSARPLPQPDRAEEHWRDTDLQIEGPAVAELQALFVAHWASQQGPPLDTTHFFPPPRPQGHEIVRIIGSTPAAALPRYYVTLLSAIRNAEKSIDLTAAYFVPTHQEREDLEHAARRGVHVRLLLPDRSDSARAIDVAHASYGDLLEAGIEIYETHGLVLHSKTVTIDGVWSVVGSSNFDHRSVLFNDEDDAVLLGSDTAAALGAMFDEDVTKAERIDPAAWAQRPFYRRLREWMSRAVESML